MRKLAWAALGFAVAAGLAEYILPVQGLPYIAAALGLISTLFVFKRSAWGRKALVCCLAAGVGVLCWWGHYTIHVAPCEALVGENITISARVTDYVERYPDYERLEVRVTDGAGKLVAKVQCVGYTKC